MTSQHGLDWPQHRPRTPSHRRKNGNFGTNKRLPGRDYDSKYPITVNEAIQRLDNELDRLGAKHPRLSTAMETKLDGRPRYNARKPDDPGAVVYFVLKGKPIALACDTYREVAQNLAALAAHLEKVRAIERYGVATANEMVLAFEALPAPSSVPQPTEQPSTDATERPWWAVLGIREDADEILIKAAYRSLSRVYHPNAGKRPADADVKWAQIQEAHDQGLAEFNRRNFAS